MPKREKGECLLCKYSSVNQEKMLKSLSVDCGGSVFSFLYQRPNSKASHSIITKRHTSDLRTMTMQEWNDILPVLKKSVKKTEERYNPAGWWFWIAIGEKAGQDFCPVPHSLIYLLPKYVKNWGNVSIPWSSKSDLPLPNPEKIKEFEKVFQPNQRGVVAEKSKIVAKLETKTDSIVTTFREHPFGVVRIFTKAHLPNNINSIDPETWQEIGQMLKELMAKIEANTDCHDFNISMLLGREAIKIFKEECQISSTAYPETELVVTMNPRFKRNPWWLKKNRAVKSNISSEKGHKFIGAFENERLALKLREPEEYAKLWGKKLPQQEEATKSLPAETSPRENIWKQPTIYLLIASGVGITCLGLGIYWLFSKKNKTKSK